MTFGYSRDDVAGFLPKYLALGILPDDPFQTVDKKSVGQLIKMAVQNGKAANPSKFLALPGYVIIYNII
jgi:pyruvate,orthophosphate dikinase